VLRGVGHASPLVFRTHKLGITWLFGTPVSASVAARTFAGAYATVWTALCRSNCTRYGTHALPDAGVALLVRAARDFVTPVQAAVGVRARTGSHSTSGSTLGFIRDACVLADASITTAQAIRAALLVQQESKTTIQAEITDHDRALITRTAQLPFGAFV
jgi:ribosomal protein L14